MANQTNQSNIDFSWYCAVCQKIHTSMSCPELDKRQVISQPSLKDGIKYDESKPDYSLIDPLFMDEFAKVLLYGGKKYEPRNWEKGMSWGRAFSALMRHSWAWWLGEDKDPESGLSHLAHATCNLMFLFNWHHYKKGTDTRAVTQGFNQKQE